MRLNTLLAVALLLLASGCSTFTPREVLQGQGNAQAWQVHKTQTSQIDGWQISGKLGIRAQHYSNARIKKPNDGIESYALFYHHPL